MNGYNEPNSLSSDELCNPVPLDDIQLNSLFPDSLDNPVPLDDINLNSLFPDSLDNPVPLDDNQHALTPINSPADNLSSVNPNSDVQQAYKLPVQKLPQILNQNQGIPQVSCQSDEQSSNTVAPVSSSANLRVNLSTLMLRSLFNNFYILDERS